jgi:hypothetical protein
LVRQIWGKIEMKGDEMIFKNAPVELEPDKAGGVLDPELVSYEDFLEQKYKLKTEFEIPDMEERGQYNVDVM